MSFDGTVTGGANPFVENNPSLTRGGEEKRPWSDLSFCEKVGVVVRVIAVAVIVLLAIAVITATIVAAVYAPVFWAVAAVVIPLSLLAAGWAVHAVSQQMRDVMHKH